MLSERQEQETLQKVLKKNVIRKFRWLKPQDKELIKELQQEIFCCGPQPAETFLSHIRYRIAVNKLAIDKQPISSIILFSIDNVDLDIGVQLFKTKLSRQDF